MPSVLRRDLLNDYIRACLKEQENRRGNIKPEGKWVKYRDDPVGFFRDCLDYYLWSKQREICEALVKYDRVAVKSCHESGKSFVSGGIAAWWIAVWPEKTAMVVTTAPTFSQVRAILWKEINRNHQRGKLPGHTNQTEWIIDNELVAFGRKPEDNSPAAFQGIHAQHLLVIFDEACGVFRALWDAGESLVANEGGKMLAIGNPDDPNTEFEAICHPGSGWHVITISAFDTPNITGEDVPEDLTKVLISRTWVEERKKRWGETSPIYRSKVLGEFPETSDDTLVLPSWVAQAVARVLPPDADDPNELGVDVARSENRNETVIYHRHGMQARLRVAVRTRDTMKIVGLVVQQAQETGARTVKVDDNGVGGGVTDRLVELSKEREIDGRPNPFYGVDVIGVNVGTTAIERPEDRREKVDPRDRFMNLKSQISWELRERFREGTIDLDEDLDTQAQICAIRYETTSKGKLKIESKEDVEDRLRKMGGMTAESGSPDRWDALVLAFAEVNKIASIIINARVLQMARVPMRRRF